MGNRNSPGLYRDSAKIWHIDKVIAGTRLRKNTMTTSLKVAETALRDAIDAVCAVKQDTVLFRHAAIHYLIHKHLARENDVAHKLAILFQWVGDTPLVEVRRSSLHRFIDHLHTLNSKTSTINSYLSVVSRILNYASEIEGEDGQPWLPWPPKIRLERITDARAPYPISWAERAYYYPCFPRTWNR